MRIDQITNCINENGRFRFWKIQSSIATLLCNSSPQILGETGKYVRNLYCLGKGDWIIQELAIVHPSLNVGSGGGRNKLFSLADSDRIYWNLPIHPFHKEQQQLLIPSFSHSMHCSDAKTKHSTPPLYKGDELNLKKYEEMETRWCHDFRKFPVTRNKSQI